MKTLSILPVLAVCIITFAGCGEEDTGSNISMYVTANSGLLIRADSNTNASKLGLAPYGAQVKVLEQSPQTMTIGGKTGHWTKVDFNGIQGWSFGGYLSATPPGPKQTQPANNGKPDCDGFRNCVISCADTEYEYDPADPDGTARATDCDASCTNRYGLTSLENCP